jgi:putative PIN family toxin of toxin-antitoxin system
VTIESSLGSGAADEAAVHLSRTSRTHRDASSNTVPLRTIHRLAVLGQDHTHRLRLEYTKVQNIVIDTNVFISSLRSSQGASYKLLFDTDRAKFTQNISTPLILEYESVAKRESSKVSLSHEQIDAIIDMICLWSTECDVSYRWRPYLKDPRDDFVLELAVQSQSDCIVSYNKRDFSGAEDFGVPLLTPKEFLELIGEIAG